MPTTTDVVVGGGVRAKKEFVYLKISLQYRALFTDFICFLKTHFLMWVGRSVGRLGFGRTPDEPHPPTPVLCHSAMACMGVPFQTPWGRGSKFPPV